MFRIIPPGDFTTTAWRNGGGVTHEIARDEASDPWRWRLSIAEVTSDGPFSVFAGYARILTVLDGAGIDLHTGHDTLAARPLRPVAFSGGLAIDGRMVDGPIRALNVICDPSSLSADVRVIKGPQTVEGGGFGAVLCLAGGACVAGTVVPPEACALLGTLGRIVLAEGAMAVHVSLRDAQTEASRPATA